MPHLSHALCLLQKKQKQKQKWNKTLQQGCIQPHSDGWARVLLFSVSSNFPHLLLFLLKLFLIFVLVFLFAVVIYLILKGNLYTAVVLGKTVTSQLCTPALLAMLWYKLSNWDWHYWFDLFSSITHLIWDKLSCPGLSFFVIFFFFFFFLLTRLQWEVYIAGLGPQVGLALGGFRAQSCNLFTHISPITFVWEAVLFRSLWEPFFPGYCIKFSNIRWKSTTCSHTLHQAAWLWFLPVCDMGWGLRYAGLHIMNNCFEI